MPLRIPRHLRTAAHLELISLIVMLANVFTVHLKPVSSLMGPTHGCAYLFVVIATCRVTQAPAPVKILALVPGVGGLLAMRQLDRGDSAPARDRSGSSNSCPPGDSLQGSDVQARKTPAAGPSHHWDGATRPAS